MKINPESAMLQQVDGHWQKLAAMLLWKLAGTDVVRITAADIEALHAEYSPGMPVIFTHGTADALEFSIVDEATAQRLVAHDAGRVGNA